ncbi:hypothetical protein K440DRAFT_612424 [Wilcoxina mikolae CBS 423.85]|nr:hypothetical protein K440DRAFT_612424 [Wilcoxina mikolae CBS 423.85]
MGGSPERVEITLRGKRFCDMTHILPGAATALGTRAVAVTFFPAAVMRTDAL